MKRNHYRLTGVPQLTRQGEQPLRCAKHARKSLTRNQCISALVMFQTPPPSPIQRIMWAELYPFHCRHKLQEFSAGVKRRVAHDLHRWLPLGQARPSRSKYSIWLDGTFYALILEHDGFRVVCPQSSVLRLPRGLILFRVGSVPHTWTQEAGYLDNTRRQCGALPQVSFHDISMNNAGPTGHLTAQCRDDVLLK